jgi:predicted ABC-type ATPase
VLKGGHSVDETIIRSRFDSGLMRLDATFERFDLVTIYLSVEISIELSLILGTEGRSFERVTPVAIRRHLHQLEDFIGDT